MSCLHCDGVAVVLQAQLSRCHVDAADSFNSIEVHIESQKSESMITTPSMQACKDTYPCLAQGLNTLQQCISILLVFSKSVDVSCGKLQQPLQQQAWVNI